MHKNMISEIVIKTQKQPFYNISPEIEIFKGKHQLPSTFKQAIKLIKRKVKYKQ
jgi:hypothetical protein